MCSTLFLVESPMWLVRRNRRNEAISTLKLLRGENYVVDEEITEMQNIREEEIKTREEKSKWSLIKSRTFLLPSLLTGISFTLQVVSGVELCCYYVGFIFQNTNIRHELTGLITMVSLVSGNRFVQKAPRSSRKFNESFYS